MSTLRDGYDWIEKCDSIYQHDREYAYAQMRLLARELLSQIDAFVTLPSDTNKEDHDAESD